MKPILELKSVSKVIGKKKIVDNLSFTVNEGEIFGFLGPNGAGKTTTIKMITGLIKITEGEIFINGFNVKNDFEKALENVGGIIENPEMYGYMTGLDNLKCYARMQNGITKERIKEVVSQVKLDNRINDKVKKYSLGMRQRLGLAQALLHNPKLLILDEPTNGLDPVGIKELRMTLRELTKTGRSVLVSSHLLSEMELMCDRFCIIDSGKLKDIKDMKDINSSNNKELNTYILDVNKKSVAKEIIENKFNTLKTSLKEDTLSVECERNIIPEITRVLVSNNIDIFGIWIYSKTLEDEFIEITGTKKIR